MMTWELTDEQKLLQVSAANYFREKMPINHLRRIRDTNDPMGFPREAWQEMAELGWTGILIDEDHGGLNFGFRGLGLILEAAGRQLAATPLLSTVAGASRLIQKLASPDQKKTLLPAIAAGETIIALAHDEGQHHDQDHATTARAQGSQYVLNGRKSLVLDARLADQILVLARTDQGLSWFLVPQENQGLRWEHFRLIDGRPAAHLELQRVEVPASALLGPLGGAAASYEDLRNAGAASLAAEMLGSATAAFEMTLAYLKERKQFGVAIGSFQALQHRMANLYCELEVSRSVVQRSLAALDEDHPNSTLFASLAKSKLSDVFHAVATESIQLHGGIGMTDEHNIGFFLKRSRINTELFGNASFHRDRYARALEF
ncbi:MAG: acyl-CoA/acyl-ACP dehydrogenase [Pseudobdellovibrionaceae bacterium]|nr:acyl-CoA/acyl-ACP dehydrogenase [Pseudobdellovibrionaceae bacterium]